MATDKTTSQMSGGRIADKINKDLKQKGKNLSISRSQVNRILKKKLIKRRVRKVFYLREKNKEERVSFCKKIIEKKIQGKDIFFTDETKIDTSSYNDFIRITKKKIKK